MAAKAPRVPSGGRVRRAVIPPKPNYSLNLWSIMKNCIGKDLSKIPMPVSGFCFCQEIRFLYKFQIISKISMNGQNVCELLNSQRYTFHLASIMQVKKAKGN